MSICSRRRGAFLASSKRRLDLPVIKTFLISATLVALVSLSSQAAEIIPPKPAGYFNDYVGVVSKEAALHFNEQLAQFERETSNQVVVAVFPKMQSDSSIEDYTQRVAESWRVGQKDKRNGIVLFVFVEDRKMIVQVGYGLEGALPDADVFNITEYKMKPQFAAGNYESGLRIGIDALLNAIRGEYKSSPTPPPQHHTKASPLWPLLFFAA